MSAMSGDNQSNSRKDSNEKKCVAILYMLMYGQSQKASWFQKVMASQLVGKGISETGLAILNKSGIATSKTTQRRELHKIAENHEKVVVVAKQQTCTWFCFHFKQ